ncbi:hypothetical protein HNP55_000467 [Paucibacter oligotrophus]|uniref:PA2779 family protein n=1 Tax=Roseateles oligotrophus TaxID=1769250 RepID=A0A840L5L4_9BURK|nr:PA2779 family protein [Roseateles oligotrophus]MBB4841972.1 hypothetical protein [Roseateles oligotrophus]
MAALQRLIASTLIVSCTLMSLPQQAQAAIVPTEALLASTAANTATDPAAARERVQSFLSREDVRATLVQQGVDADAAAGRVAAMSDAEVAQLAGRIDQAPAGGDILGLVFTVFIVLLVTDILGLTKVFPFTRSVR